MINYKGKAKCYCGKRATKKLDRGFSGSLSRCNDHKKDLDNMIDEPEDDRKTLADFYSHGNL